MTQAFNNNEMVRKFQTVTVSRRVNEIIMFGEENMTRGLL